MSLYIETHGQGPNMVMLHGWGLSGNVWEGVVEQLHPFFRVSIIDLPGYGRSDRNSRSDDNEAINNNSYSNYSNYSNYSLHHLAEEVTKNIEPNSIILGWSLGGMIAVQMALDYPEYVNRLILVASSPQYFKSEDWPHAVNREILQGFAAELLADYKATILHFLAIQALGSDHAQDEIRLLKKRVFRDGLPDPRALQAGLDILLNTNLRQQLTQITCPSLILNGKQDRLVPFRSGQAIAEMIPNSQFKWVQGAGHAPFISHPDVFVEYLKEFIQ